MDIIKLIEVAEKNGMTHFGLRKHHESCAVGDYLGVSFDTFDDAESVELAGLCTVGLDWDGFDIDNLELALAELERYQGFAILVGGAFADYGNDDGELLIASAQCIGIL